MDEKVDLAINDEDSDKRQIVNETNQQLSVPVELFSQPTQHLLPVRPKTDTYVQISISAVLYRRKNPILNVATEENVQLSYHQVQSSK